MLLSIALILLVGMSMGWLCQKMKLPGLLGMLATGIVLGPYVLDLLDPSILGISAELRKIALIIILTRAGLGLDLSGLKKIGRPAVLMCFVPASFELLGMLLLAPKLMGLSILEAAVMGAVLAAVSPAVVVPRMVKLMDEGYGVKEGIPQLILAGASVDDVYVIVLFSTFTGMMQGTGASAIRFINIPVSIFLGIAIGLGIGVLLAYIFQKIHMRDTSKVLIILSISFLLVVLEDYLATPITFSALIAVMFIGIGLQKKREVVANRLSAKYGKLWVASEVFLFVLVGATVNIGYIGKVGIKALIVIAGALVFRMFGVLVCLLGTEIKGKERMFTMLAYTPKATVQAAIGGIPLSLGFACGESVLAVSVLAIVLTAPLGAFAIDLTYKKFLKKNKYVYGPDKYYKMNYFATIDLDKNGVKELIMIDKSNREVTVYTYTNGKVKYCGNMYDRGIVYIDKNGRLARRFNNSGVKMNYYLTLNKKKQLSLVSYTYDKAEKKYYKETGVVESSEDYNRSKISKKTYNKAVKKSDFAKNVSKHLNNSSNRDKYLK